MNIDNITIDPSNWEAESVEKAFADIQDAMRLGLIAGFTELKTFEPLKPAYRTYTFVVYDEHLTKLQEAEKEGNIGRTDDGV